ncbi:MAG: energy transducer TonB [Alphaproteobacteria bacterium]|nr:energy transducer TonB [Alphaproteobacteria bacterium]
MPPSPPPAPVATPPEVRIGKLGIDGRIEDPNGVLIPAEPESGNWPPTYPREAALLGQQGTVTLRIHVAADGTVTAVDVTESSGYPLLDQAARKAILAWRYSPARRADGSMASAVTTLKIQFAP